MSVLEKNIDKVKQAKGTYDPSLDNVPVPRAALEKAEKARKFLEEHPIPEHIFRQVK